MAVWYGLKKSYLITWKELGRQICLLWRHQIKEQQRANRIKHNEELVCAHAFCFHSYTTGCSSKGSWEVVVRIKSKPLIKLTEMYIKIAKTLMIVACSMLLLSAYSAYGQDMKSKIFSIGIFIREFPPLCLWWCAKRHSFATCAGLWFFMRSERGCFQIFKLYPQLFTMCCY